MYKLLIADDENIIRQGIVEMFQKNVDYFQIFEAENGEEVLDIVEEEKMDALIIDIKMPKMNGITVLKELWMTNRSVLTVVLTGYDEFDYAKSALEYGAVKYILKPMIPSQLMDLAGELKSILDSRAEKQKELDMLREEFLKNRQFQKEKFFQDILNGSHSEARMRERIKVLELKVQGPLYQAAVIGIQHYGLLTAKENHYLLDYSMNRYVQDYCEGQENMECFQMNTGQYALLFNLDVPNNRIVIDTLYELKEQIEEKFKVTCAAGLGIPCSGIERIRYSYSSAESTVRYLNIQNYDYVVAADDIRENQGAEASFFDMEEYMLVLKSGKKEKVSEYIEKFFKRASDDKSTGVDKTDFYLNMDQMLLGTYQCLLQSGGRMEELELSEFAGIRRIYQLNTLEDIKKFIEETAFKVCGIISGIKTDGRNNTIRRIEQIVSEEYKNPLSMRYIADKLYLNHIYLGQIFKKETGISLNDYINKVRISKAKKLLKSSNSMVYEVAEQVGFSDSQYFSTVFKKIVGVSPKEYKDM